MTHAACLVLREPDQADSLVPDRALPGHFRFQWCSGSSGMPCSSHPGPLPRTSRAVFCAWQLLHIGWSFARSRVVAGRLDAA